MASTKLSSVLEKAKVKKEVPPDLMTVLLIDMGETLVDISEMQGKILKHMQEVTPEGVDIPIPVTVVTGETTLHFVRDYPYHRLRSIDLFNKGPSTAYYRVNEDAKEIEVEDRESVRIERPRATIEYMTLRVATGQATIQLTGHY